MAAFRENAYLIMRRLGRVGDARASAVVKNSESTHHRLRRVYENAAEHHRCMITTGRNGIRHFACAVSQRKRCAKSNREQGIEFHYHNS